MATPQTPPPSGTQALDNLQAMVNLVLMQTGHIFKDPKKATSVKAQYGLKRAVPAAVDRFHDSLDELEDEIHRAQAVFRRDLALVRTDRAKREQAEAEERQRVATEAATGPAPRPAETQGEKNDIMQGLDDLLGESNPPAKGKAPQAPAPPPDEPAKQQPSVSAPSTAAPVSAPVSAPVPSIPVSVPTLIDTTAGPVPDPRFDATPTTANLNEEFDFDSMFNDEPLGQPADTAQNDTSNELHFDLGGDDSQSLLRGLEDFANSTQENTNTAQNAVPNLGGDADFSMLDLSAVPTTGASNPGHQDLLAAVGDLTSGAPAQQNLPAHGPNDGNDILSLEAIETNFEDLFDWPDNNEGTQFEDQFMDFGD